MKRMAALGMNDRQKVRNVRPQAPALPQKKRVVTGSLNVMLQAGKYTDNHANPNQIGLKTPYNILAMLGSS